MKFLIFILVLLSSAHALENKLLPFTTDGCSAVPDIDLIDCCKVHDLAYWKGGLESERLQSDLLLSSCVEKKMNPLFGSMFYMGVRLGGTPMLSTSFRWGYGWIYKRGYGRLSIKEREQVKKLSPRDPTLVPVTAPKLRLDQRPLTFGNYCFDQIHEVLKRKFKNQKIRLSIVRGPYQVVVKAKLKGKNILFTYKNTKWKECHTPQFQAKLPRFYKAIYFK